jgi:hypothetical protein
VVRVVLIDGPLAPDAPGVEARIVLREAEPVGPAALHASALAVAIRCAFRAHPIALSDLTRSAIPI